jgi:hypothetical protein
LKPYDIDAEGIRQVLAALVGADAADAAVSKFVLPQDQSAAQQRHSTRAVAALNNEAGLSEGITNALGGSSTPKLIVSAVLKRYDTRAEIGLKQATRSLQQGTKSDGQLIHQVAVHTKYPNSDSDGLFLVFMEPLDRGFFRVSNDWAFHPDGTGYIHDWQSSASKAALVAGNGGLLKNSLSTLENQVSQQVAALKRRFGLGEIDKRTYQQGCREIEDAVHERFLRLVNSAPGTPTSRSARHMQHSK